MHATHHCKARQAQLGIPLKMIDYVLAHGTVDQDEFIIGTKEAKQRLADLEREKRLLMKTQIRGASRSWRKEMHSLPPTTAHSAPNRLLALFLEAV